MCKRGGNFDQPIDMLAFVPPLEVREYSPHVLAAFQRLQVLAPFHYSQPRRRCKIERSPQKSKQGMSKPPLSLDPGQNALTQFEAQVIQCVPDFVSFLGTQTFDLLETEGDLGPVKVGNGHIRIHEKLLGALLVDNTGFPLCEDR